MSDIPIELRYLSSHEWVRVEDGVATIGITDHAQKAMGDLVFVEVPDIGTTLAAGDEAGVVESVKAASDIYTPVSGEVIEVNERLEAEPELVNSDSYGEGWMFKIQMADEQEVENTLTADEYQEQLDDE
ncbi:glycine cleavage system protein GcvH [Ketobacter sp. MCCC 1A13808]|uniref:glycine cleavage system protein GcvH n=1 Tax=Ketobacter sp. MCCC 1A13808 TaxID=2602738 RepID=UPI000F132F37|nr:glycine cleavage system protein GcvH [Ketobacter sp. MCCC 1A13808]MVF11817.1 glycine cleavage system protein GcvH [Ketobacter sp. MCCC 1A13808]RLP55421.1 MAG: glycine cleavage system protein GcvH [Ketobacter sp.]